MSDVLLGLIDRLTEAYRCNRHLLLLFDFDGTLVPLAADPQSSRLDARVRRRLACLAARQRVSVGIVSSRNQVDLQGKLGRSGVYLAGTGRGWTKGIVVWALATALGPRTVVPLYAGDAEDDREAMEAVLALGGISVGVGPAAPSAANYRLASPQTLHAMLASLSCSLRNLHAPPPPPTARPLAVYGLMRPLFPSLF